MKRREFIQAAAVATLGARLGAQQTTAVKALVFDTFGTVVDYRSSIISEGRALGKAKGLTVDWEKFADAWRGAYGPALDRVRKGELPWTTLDTLHRMMLDKVLADFGVKSEGDFEDILAADTPAIWISKGPTKGGEASKMLAEIVEKAAAIKAGRKKAPATTARKKKR